ncbi:MAG: hypothetical protein RJB65_508 [Actinomycetota bacterium]
MQPVVLLAVAAVWAAVIVPPLMRSREENRPNSSVTDFRRQLSTLQRTVPTRTMVPARGMARPLTQAPTHAPRNVGTRAHTGPIERPRLTHGRTDHAGHTQTHLHRVSRRELTRRRRMNAMFVLASATVLTGFLAATTKATSMTWAFAIAFIATCAYAYKLAQLRAYELDRRANEQHIHRAA